MNELTKHGAKTFFVATLDPSHGSLRQFPRAPFVCLIWDHDGEASERVRESVGEILLSAGCRYLVCGGHSCGAWELSMDVEVTTPGKYDEADHVMTTSHSDESPDDVAFFFVCNTNFDNHDFMEYLVLHIGSAETHNELNRAVTKYARGQDAV